MLIRRYHKKFDLSIPLEVPSDVMRSKMLMPLNKTGLSNTWTIPVTRLLIFHFHHFEPEIWENINQKKIKIFKFPHTLLKIISSHVSLVTMKNILLAEVEAHKSWSSIIYWVIELHNSNIILINSN